MRPRIVRPLAPAPDGEDASPRPAWWRRALRATSLRQRLLGLVLLTLLPPSAALWWTLADGAAARLAQAEQQMAREAMLRAQEQAALIDKTHLALAVLARQPAVRAAEADPVACGAAAAAALQDAPWLRGIAVGAPDGTILCSSNGAGLGVSVEGRDYFRRALGFLQPTVSGLLSSRVDGLPQIVAALPTDENGDGLANRVMLGVLHLDRLLAAGPIGGTGEVAVLDGAGRLAASVPPAGPLLGRAFDEQPIWRVVQGSAGAGAWRGPGLDGAARVTGFARVPGTDAVVLVGRTEHELLAPLRAQLRRAVAVAVAGVLLAALLAWLFGRGMLMTDLRRLAQAAAGARGASAGSFRALSLSPLAAAEIHTLHDALREMEQRQAQAVAESMAKTALLEAVTAAMAQGLAAWDGEGRLLVSNQRYRELLDLPADFAEPGRRFIEVARHLADRGDFGPGDPEALAHGRLVLATHADGRRRELVRPNGRVLELTDRTLPGGGFVTTFTDTTERHAAEARAAHLARHDALTGLPNRLMLNEHLAAMLVEAARGGGRLAVLYLDLDRFKWVNDTLGHPVGDGLLRQVAARIRSRVRSRATGGDLVARLGGDEFAIVTAPAFGLHADPAAEAVTIAERLIAALAEPFDVQGHRVLVGTSVGIALHPADGETPEALLRQADLALYRAKQEGRGRFRFFESGMDTEAQARRQMELELRRALDEAPEEFELHYQPVLGIASRRVTGFEALVRWRHPTRGLVPPAAFVSLAEEIGLVERLGELVLRQACAEAASWPEPALRIAVNLSPAQFRRGALVQTVAGILAETGLSPGRLELEITEGVLLQRTEETLETLRRLRATGVRIAMDDFGTGYSSLGYLRSFHFDKVKIDRSFVRDLPQRPEDAAIVAAVAGLCRTLGIVTTAEGVETEEQLCALRRHGCAEAQGFLFSRPVPAAQLPALRRHLAGATAG
jgi:diguanylate cyclase (GGDEF)-like protein